jgi:ribosomal protein L37AE/L43A
MSDPLIVITDPPDVKPDTRCPKCGSTARHQSVTMGPVHDVCSGCRHNFAELTVPDRTEADDAEGW